MGFKYRGVFCSLFIVMSGTLSAARLPQNFYSFVNSKVTSTATIKDEAPIFYIVVPESSVKITETPARAQELAAFVNDTVVPAAFFNRVNPKVETKPVVLFFEWQEKENSKTRKQAGQLLAEGLNSLRNRFKKGSFIVVGHGQGGNLISVASNNVKVPIETVIQIATPIFPQPEKGKKDLYAEYRPHKTMIQKLYSFYSEQAFSMPHPTLHPHYTHVYDNAEHPNMTNILLLINNKHPLPGEVLRPLVGKKLLALCNTISTTYRYHNNLVAHLSTIKSDTDMIVALRDNTVSNTPADKNETQAVAQERLLSEVRMKHFAKTWGRPMALSLNKGEKNRQLHKSIELMTTQKKA